MISLISSCIGSVIILFLHGAHGAFEIPDPFAQGLEVPVPGHLPAPYLRFFDGNAAGVYAGHVERTADHCEAGDGNSIADREVPGNSNGPPDDAVPADHGAAGNPRAAGDHCMSTDADVVAELDLVIELHALLD